jgi:hypothetical protein
MDTIQRLPENALLVKFPNVDFALTEAVAATLTLNPAGSNNSILWTAAVAGADGDLVNVVYVDPEAEDSPLSFTVSRGAVETTVTVSLATDGDGLITSTAQEVIDAAALDEAVADVVTAAASGTVTGVLAAASGSLSGGRNASPDLIALLPPNKSFFVTDVYGVIESVSGTVGASEFTLSRVDAEDNAVTLASVELADGYAAGFSFTVADVNHRVIPANNRLKFSLATGSNADSDLRTLFVRLIEI